MATTKNTTAAPAPEAVNDERVEIFIPRGGANEDPNFFVSVNGVSYLMPRGKTSSVPKHIAEEIKRSWAAQAELDDKIDAMIAVANNPALS